MKKFKSLACAFLAAIIAVSAFAGCSGDQGVDSAFDVTKIKLSEDQVSDISSEIDELLDDNIYYGGALVKLNKNEVYKDYFGMADKKSTPVNEKTRYLISSATMAFTAVAINKLADDDKLSLNDSLSMYYDSDKYEFLEEVSVKDLLTTSVSLGNYSSEMNQNQKEKNKLIKLITSKKKNSGKKIKSMIEKHILKMGVVPGKSPNSNYYILGRIIEQASGMGYDEYLKKYIFDELGMKNTGFVSLKQKAVGYNKKNRTWVRQSDNKLICSYDYLYSSFGMYSTVDDMNKFFEAFIAKKLCKTDIAKQALRKRRGFSYGFETDGKTIYIRAGANLHRVYLCINPKTQELVMLLTNTVGSSDLAKLGKSIYNKVNSKVNGILLENSQ